MPPSLYIHIPFCKSKCAYCDFYSIISSGEIISDYIGVLVTEIKNIKHKFSTIYIGGGTPTVLESTLLERLLKAISYLVDKDTEFSFEANPESLDEEKLKLLKFWGVNRLSIGVQSFSDEKLKKLNRLHTAEEAQSAIIKAYQCGFDNISIDLIFGVWGETFSDWQSELQKVSSFPVVHISLYMLTYEKNTPLFSLLKKKLVKPLCDEEVSRMYKYNSYFLRKIGFNHYEVSNFARGDKFCRHNLNYWRNGSYLGLGAGAVSYLEGVRRKNIADVGDYIQRAKKRESFYCWQERLSFRRHAQETLALGMRTSKGINFKYFFKKTGFDALSLKGYQIKELKKYKLISYKRYKGKIYGVKPTLKGYLFSDTIAEYLI